MEPKAGERWHTRNAGIVDIIGVNPHPDAGEYKRLFFVTKTGTVIDCSLGGKLFSDRPSDYDLMNLYVPPRKHCEPYLMWLGLDGESTELTRDWAAERLRMAGQGCRLIGRKVIEIKEGEGMEGTAAAT